MIPGKYPRAGESAKSENTPKPERKGGVTGAASRDDLGIAFADPQLRTGGRLQGTKSASRAKTRAPYKQLLKSLRFLK